LSVIQSLYSIPSALVHPSRTASPIERARHESFIALKLAVAFAVLAVAPFYLAFKGAPTAAGVLIFSFALLSLAAAMVVSRTGNLVAGHIVTFCALVGLGTTLFYGVGTGIGCALACLIVAQMEAAISNDKGVTLAAAAITTLTFASVAFATTSGLSFAGDTGSAAIVEGLALLYAAAISHRAALLADLSRRSLRDDDERARTIKEALGDLVIGFDSAGSVDHVSNECEALIGVSRADLIGRGLFDHIHVADRPAFLKIIGDAAHGSETMSAKVRLRTWTAETGASGHVEPRHIWIDMRARRIRRQALHHAPEVVAILRDVTAAHEHDIEIERAQRSIESAIRSKDHFLANMSHELRTPLNAIIGFSEMLGSRTLRPIEADKQRDYARIIHQSGQHLLAVVNSILDMSKIQSGTFSIIPEAFEIAPLVDLCCEMVALKARDGMVDLVRDCPTGLESIVADRRACKQILINLVSNAVKFTPEQGRVVVKVRPEGNAMVISVTDTGIGIGATDLACLGDPFFQARASLSRPYEGTGLGLSVVRGLIGLHGGSIVIESELSKGTIVTVRLPLDCRAIVEKSTSAVIDTIPRCDVPKVAVPRSSDLRMKQIA
jgi:cell cycle sensor histidine kinase DivJ